MNLTALLQGFAEVAIDCPLTGLSLDSREITTGYAFIALAGSKQHGLLHAAQAIAQGAIAIIYDPSEQGDRLAQAIQAVPTVAVVDLAFKLGAIAARFYNSPAQSINVIGITGTNGKTSCSHFLSQLLENCAIIGTLGWGQHGTLQPTLNTTPDALSIQKMLSALLQQNKQVVAMEVSSHALVQGRVEGIAFKGVVFTNITRDHLDYHGTMDAYVQAKLSLLDKPGIEFVVVNLDDAYSNLILARIPPNVAVWGVSASGKTIPGIQCLSAQAICHTMEGLRFTVRWQQEVEVLAVPLYGSFNVDNALNAIAVGLAMGMELRQLTTILKDIKPVPGRMQALGGGMLPLVFIDYAHTPDALAKVLSSAREHCPGKLWVVFGCGGNRDIGKRPQMGQIAASNADAVIITDDNPRFEESAAIIKDILSNCVTPQLDVMPDRKIAIQEAVIRAGAGDCIVVAGKGHEDYQEISGVRHPFNDWQVVMDALDKRIMNL
jgi:UDP-N-acetylmuramoyl-L-alanyl-D-glutamate--2,6-diaminopimelate ligase